jgi:hypothetical protein
MRKLTPEGYFVYGFILLFVLISLVICEML